MNIKNTHRLFEITAVAVTGLCKYIFVDLYPFKFWYIIITSLFWILYVLSRWMNEKEVIQYWGFSRAGFKASFLQFLPFALLSVAAFLVYGFVKNTIIFNWHLLPVLLLYPLWGVIQQFLIVGLIAGNLNDMKGARLPRPVIVVITAIVFSIVHYPSVFLIAATFILAMFYTPIYLKNKNLWVLGIYHGWLACFFYFFVLERDPWNELMSTF